MLFELVLNLIGDRCFLRFEPRNYIACCQTLVCRVWRQDILGESAKPSLAEIRQEISELLDKQVNAQKESLKNTFRVHGSSCKLVL